MTKREVVAQKHGGALLPGGLKGNKGGTGRPSNELRALMREGAYQSIPKMVEMLDSKWVSVNTKIRICDLLLRYGLGTPAADDAGRVDREEVFDLLSDMADVVREALLAELPREQATRILERIRESWRALQTKKGRAQ